MHVKAIFHWPREKAPEGSVQRCPKNKDHDIDPRGVVELNLFQ